MDHNTAVTDRRTTGKGLPDIQLPRGFAVEAASTALIRTSAHLGSALSHPAGLLRRHPRRRAGQATDRGARQWWRAAST